MNACHKCMFECTTALLFLLHILPKTVLVSCSYQIGHLHFGKVVHPFMDSLLMSTCIGSQGSKGASESDVEKDEQGKADDNKADQSCI